MNKMIAAGLMMFSMGMAAWAEPVEKNTANQPAPAPIVTTTAQSQPSQPTPPAPAKKPIELNFRNF